MTAPSRRKRSRFSMARTKYGRRRDAEDGLDDDRAGEQVGGERAEEGDDREDGDAQGVAHRDRGRGRGLWRARCG
jgi:hypothetical protein